MNLPRIIQLDPLVANQIAAGEVIERPASIIKELVENALDANATEIEIDVEGAGVHLIRVHDNGMGITKDDLPLAFSRHATSKMRTSEDLFAIRSLGFRGEALASIAAVARCKLISCVKGHTAWQMEYLPHDHSEIIPAAHDVGTTVEVADVFYNVPVRRKFLRSPKTEFQAMEEMLKRLALSYPNVRFKLTHQQRLVRDFPAVSSTWTEDKRIAKICGQHFIDHAVKIEIEAGDLSLHGWIGLPENAHRQADCQYFFINQRIVKDRFIHQIIKTHFQDHPAYVEGSYPCYILYLQIDPTQIDVNVHPTKQEVRFHQPRWIHDFLSKAVGEGLSLTIEQDLLTENRMLNDSSKEEIYKSRMPAYSLEERHKHDTSLDATKEVYENRTSFDNTKELYENKPASRRYAFIQKEDSVYKIDLDIAKASLLSMHFLQLQGKIPQKNLLFPVIMPSLSIDFSVVQSILKNWGFTLQKQEKHWVLLQQPAMINMISYEEFNMFLKECLQPQQVSNEKNIHLQEYLQRNENDIHNVIAHYLANHTSVDYLFELKVREFDQLLLRWVSQERSPLIEVTNEMA